MLTLKRSTRNFMAFVCVINLFVYACGAETLASYSGQYTADLEQKQALLESIKEDAYKTENEMKESINKGDAAEKKKMSCLEFESIGLAKLVPPAGKINAAFINMSGTLSPRSGGYRLPQDRDRSRN